MPFFAFSEAIPVLSFVLDLIKVQNFFRFSEESGSTILFSHCRRT